MARPGAKRLTNCPECLTLFPQWPNTGVPKYCSVECRHKAASKRFSKQAMRACLWCGKEFAALTSPSRAAENRDRYCSRGCANKAKTTAVTRPCVRCGDPLKVKPSDGKYHAKKYCSSQCYWQTVRESEDMRRAPRKDDNHDDVAEVFEKSGFVVLDMSAAGRGMPDLIVSYGQVIKMVEIKNPKTGYGRRGLNKHQVKFKERGFPVCVVNGTDQALEFIRLFKALTTDSERNRFMYPVAA
jgi:Holliday junction resolvase